MTVARLLVFSRVTSWLVLLEYDLKKGILDYNLDQRNFPTAGRAPLSIVGTCVARVPRKAGSSARKASSAITLSASSGWVFPLIRASSFSRAARCTAAVYSSVGCSAYLGRSLL